MKIAIKRFDKTLPLPAYKTTGAAAFDLQSREEVRIAPGKVGYVPLNVALAIPEGHTLLLAARSSLHKRGLIPANAVGVIDSDYRGDGDELVAALFNFSDVEVVIPRGERIMQGLIVPVVYANFAEVERMGSSDRGGFGSTGVL
jgi:dUTP pyrophosphatase